jgi:hypothetical protein
VLIPSLRSPTGSRRGPLRRVARSTVHGSERLQCEAELDRRHGDANDRRRQRHGPTTARPQASRAPGAAAPPPAPSRRPPPGRTGVLREASCRA